MAYGPADGRYGNAGNFVKSGHAASPPVETAKNDLIHDTQLIKRTVTSVLLGEPLIQDPRERDKDLRCDPVLIFSHELLSVPRTSR